MLSFNVNEPSAGSLLYILEGEVTSLMGYCQPVSETDPTPRFEANGFVGVMLPVRANIGARNTSSGVQSVFNVLPLSGMDWVTVVFFKPSSYYLAGPETTKVYQDAYRAFQGDYERAQLQRAGVHTPTLADLERIKRTH